LPLQRLRLVPKSDQTPRWSYVMISEDDATLAVARIHTGEKPYTTLKVWLAVMFATGWNTCEITAKPRELAARAKVHEVDVRRGLSYLTRLGILRRVGRGRYEVNPEIAWRGDLSARQKAEERWGVPVTSP
jgi:hypothetical protein